MVDCGCSSCCPCFRKSDERERTIDAQKDVNEPRYLDDESLDGIAGGHIRYEGRAAGVSTYSIIDDESGEVLEMVSVAGGDDSAAFMAARKRAIELGLSPKKVY